MGRNFDDVLKGLPPERRSRIKANADAKHKEYLALELDRYKAAYQILTDTLQRIDKGVSEHHVGWKGEVMAARNEARLGLARAAHALKEDPNV